MKTIKQFPHCDPRMLHEPGVCEFCDSHPDWQGLRLAWDIKFTGSDARLKDHIVGSTRFTTPVIISAKGGGGGSAGCSPFVATGGAGSGTVPPTTEAVKTLQPCPFEVARPAGSTWHGNQPSKTKTTDGLWWLIEQKSQVVPSYYRVDGSWTTNANEATQWKNREDAQAYLKTMPPQKLGGLTIEVAEHMFIDIKLPMLRCTGCGQTRHVSSGLAGQSHGGCPVAGGHFQTASDAAPVDTLSNQSTATSAGAPADPLTLEKIEEIVEQFKRKTMRWSLPLTGPARRVPKWFSEWEQELIYGTGIGEPIGILSTSTLRGRSPIYDIALANIDLSNYTLFPGQTIKIEMFKGAPPVVEPPVCYWCMQCPASFDNIKQATAHFDASVKEGKCCHAWTTIKSGAYKKPVETFKSTLEKFYCTQCPAFLPTEKAAIEHFKTAPAFRRNGSGLLIHHTWTVNEKHAYKPRRWYCRDCFFQSDSLSLAAQHELRGTHMCSLDYKNRYCRCTADGPCYNCK